MKRMLVMMATLVLLAYAPAAMAADLNWQTVSQGTKQAQAEQKKMDSQMKKIQDQAAKALADMYKKGK